MIRSVLLAASLTLWAIPAVLAQVSEDLLEHKGEADKHQLSTLSDALEDVLETPVQVHRGPIRIVERHQLLPLLPPPVFSGVPGQTSHWVTDLEWAGASPQEVAFMGKVYTRQIERASTKTIFQANEIGEKVVSIESGQSAIPEAVKACRAMLKAARQSRGATRFRVLSAYRSARKQLVNWQLNFPEYYRRTATERSQVPGGAFGSDAVELLATYIEQRLASPGYSLHNGGIAIDFITWEGGREFSALTQPDILSGWKQTWLFHWLSEHAEQFRFFQNAGIDEPWHWEYRALIHPLPEASVEVHISHKN